MSVMIMGFDNVEGQWDVPIEDARCVSRYMESFEYEKVPSMMIEDGDKEFCTVLTSHIELVADGVVVERWEI